MRFKTKHSWKTDLSSSEKNPLQCRVRIIFTFSPAISYLSRSTKLSDQLSLFAYSSLLTHYKSIFNRSCALLCRHLNQFQILVQEKICQFRGKKLICSSAFHWPPSLCTKAKGEVEGIIRHQTWCACTVILHLVQAQLPAAGWGARRTLTAWGRVCSSGPTGLQH